MSDAKITLSAKELELVCNIDWILTKHVIIEKVYRLLGKAAEYMQSLLPEVLPGSGEHRPKITKGEHYEGLPYVVLDYPRYFDKENTLAIRTLFWWGNTFSVHLIVSGSYKAAILPLLQQHFSTLREKEYAICIAADRWQHHFREDNYWSLKDCAEEQYRRILGNGSFVKIGKSLPLEQWDKAPAFIEATFGELVMLLKP